MKRRLTILGSTGSVGCQAMDVLRAYPDRFELVGLSASSNANLLREQAAEFDPQHVALENGDASILENLPAKILSGTGSARTLAEEPADIVLNGIIGFAGLSATVGALEAGSTVALANKESLVTGGEWVTNLAPKNRIIPVDSEHSAIFQCLLGHGESEVDQILLTASGGPFFVADKGRLQEVGPGDALKHPTWQMGRKITIDSATMMNKGLEVIEAHHLFGVSYDKVKVVVHRQSAVHGGAILKDGSVILHAAIPDMRLPIAYGIFHPERVDAGVEPVDFAGISWTFDAPRHDVFRCLPLAIQAGKAGGAYPVALNAANEVVVDAFLDSRIKFLQIADAIEEVLQIVPDSEFGEMKSMEAIEYVDLWARSETKRQIESLAQ